ncbi:MAG: HlyD family efflux transporter periplasmic adaptor subunit [Saprospiraceae bacterium]
MNQPDIEIRSEEVQEILGTPPGWLTRWGTTVALIVFLVLIWTSYWIRYPDIIKKEITVTSTEPPRKIYSANSGYIARILVRNEQPVDSGQVLIALQSDGNSSVDDVMAFDDALSAVNELDAESLLAFSPPMNLLLGDIQEDFYSFLEDQETFRQSRRGRMPRSNSSIRELQKRVDDLEKEIQQNNRDKRRVQDELDAQTDALSRERRLYQQRKTSSEALRKREDAIRQLDRELQGLSSDSKSKRFEIQMLENQINGEKKSSQFEGTRAFEDMKNSFIRLQNTVQNWKDRHLIVAPIKGTVVLTNSEIGPQQFVNKEMPLLSIVPAQTTETLGTMLLAVDGSGKVDTGQQVIVNFKSYPAYEYGAVIGKVKWKGKVPTNQTIPVEVSFPNGLTTTRGRQIDPAQQLNGEAQIITSNKRLIEKIFENFRRITSG